ncbi:MAG: CBS and ACT domain-containing protein [Desulfobacteraceae bacterium]|nr:CBS and ACT domain-containing protein [Desulfobacteraceae bacterium]
MLVKNWMTKNVVTIEQDDSMQQALALMKENDIGVLPVMNSGVMVGIVSDTDLKRASASDATMLDTHELLYLISKIKISEIMTKKVITVPEDFTVEETAQVMMEHNISAVPVTDQNGKLVGIITRHDLFKILISLSGLGKRGIQFAFLIDDVSGSIKSLTDVIRRYDGRIASILSSYEYAPPGKRIVYIRIYEVDRSRLPELIQEFRDKGTLIYLVDHRQNKRKIYHDIMA